VEDSKDKPETSLKGRPESNASIEEDPTGQESALRDVPSKKQSIDDEDYSIP